VGSIPIARSIKPVGAVGFTSNDTGGSVQIVDGNTGHVLLSFGFFATIIQAVAVNKNATRYAFCVAPAAISPTLVILDASLNLL
jgi:hypothetical protein